MTVLEMLTDYAEKANAIYVPDGRKTVLLSEASNEAQRKFFMDRLRETS